MSIIPTVAQALTGSAAITTAQSIADQNGAPVAIWEGASSYCISEVPPEDDLDVEPEAFGYALFAIVDPSRWDLGELN